MDRRQFIGSALVAGIAATRVRCPLAAAEGEETIKQYTNSPAIEYRLTRQTPTKLFNAERCYAHPRAGIVPEVGKDGQPRVVMTMNTVELTGSDVFKAVHGMMT